MEKVFLNVVLNVWYKVNNLNEQMIYDNGLCYISVFSCFNLFEWQSHPKVISTSTLTLMGTGLVVRGLKN